MLRPLTFCGVLLFSASASATETQPAAPQTEYRSVPLIVIGAVGGAGGIAMTIGGLAASMHYSFSLYGGSSGSSDPGPTILFFSGLGTIALSAVAIVVGSERIPVQPTVAVTPRGVSAGVSVSF